MKKAKYWVARMTLDALEACIAEKRLGANDKNLGRLKKLSSGDKGFFYVSTRELYKDHLAVSEFMNMFQIEGDVESISIDVPTLPIDKSMLYSVRISVFETGSIGIHDVKNKLQFIRRPEYWGSYLMQSFIEISEADYEVLSEYLGAKA